MKKKKNGRNWKYERRTGRYHLSSERQFDLEKVRKWRVQCGSKKCFSSIKSYFIAIDITF